MALGSSQEDQDEGNKYPLIKLRDLYCSFFILEGSLPETEISGAEREGEKILFRDDDIVYINRGLRDGLEEGQLFLALEAGPKIKNFGQLMFMKGRVRLTILEDNRSIGKVEDSCGAVQLGNVLLPFIEKEGLSGKDEGFDVFLKEGEGISGNFLYLENDNVQIGSGHRAVIDLGRESGIEVGQQLLIFRQSKEDAPLKTIGNSVVIDVQNHSSTIKVLSNRDAITIEDHVRLHHPLP
jgi:hypothetical protein